MTELEWLQARYAAGDFAAAGDLSATPDFLRQRCGDCPFWDRSLCRVWAEYRPRRAVTCRYIDPPNHLAAVALIERRRWLLQEESA